MGIFGIVTATVIVGFLGVYEATHCPVHGRPDPDYIVVLKHRGPDTVQLHLESFERGFDIEPHIKDIFTNLASLNVHAYVISDVDCLAVLQSASTVEYIERVSYFSVLPTENCNDSNDVIPDGDDYEIPDFSKSPLTTFLSSDSACTLSYEHFRHFANLPEESLLSPRSIVYSVGTGIDLQHPTFDGRAVWGFDAVSGSAASLGDLHGHGTYVAGLIVGQYHGVARRSTVVDVRAMDEMGSGSTVHILTALNYIAGQAIGDKSTVHIINLSFSGERSVAIRDAVRSMMEVSVFVAAIGDSSTYSCFSTPANIPDILVVSGVDLIGNVVLPYSNFGECVSIKAPGLLTSSSVPGAWAEQSSVVRNEPTRGYEVRRAGSSGAAAIVTGLLAVLTDYVQNDEKLSNAATFTLRTRGITNFMKNGSMLHYQGNGNDQKIHKYPYVPCMLGEVDENWKSAVERMISNIWAIVGTTHVFNHFERVRRQFMESAKHHT